MSDWDKNDGRDGWGTPDNAGQPPTSAGPTNADANETREWRLIEKLVMSLQGEQRKTRRWGIFFKSLTFLYLFVLLYLAFSGVQQGLSEAVGAHAGVVDVNGVIAQGEEASAENIIEGLRAAFESENTRGVILRINSPGGSPVQADYVYQEIVRLRAEHPDIPVYAVIADIGASGAYYIAAAADKIYANRASLVGSIGVVSGGFGFVDAMDKLGVERRLYTAGEHKAFLDPFSPQDPEEIRLWERVLENTHQLFIERVLEGRGDRLNTEQSDELFSGMIWTGDQALPLGLVDGFASVDDVAREVIGVEQTVDYSRRPSVLEELASQLGASAGEALFQAVSEARLEMR